ncbi:MAG: hypothetical protein MUF15_25295, partial [Acidobacteria bacterium]|nr:hypothetical protein [Acidobacteriota bacterium]
EMYRQTPSIAEFFEENSLELMNGNLVEIALQIYINRILETFPGHENEINTAMIMIQHQDGISADYPLEHYSNKKYREILQSMNLEGDITVCDFQHLTIKNNCVFYNGKRILLIHENYGGVVPEEIIKAFQKGNLILNVGPLTFLVSNKLNIALLSEHEESNLFTGQERENIKKYIPWSRKTIKGQTRYRGETVKLESFGKANKEKLVLKPALGFGGKNIFIGLHTPQQEWEKAIETAFAKKNWVIQEYIAPSRYIFQEGETGYSEQSTAWGIFVFAGSYAGFFLRTLPVIDNKGIINAKQGAEVSIAFEVRE